jgi:hypothetical protein
MKLKAELGKMTKAEREDSVLRKFTGYKSQSLRTGTTRMVKEDEETIQGALQSIVEYCEAKGR